MALPYYDVDQEKMKCEQELFEPLAQSFLETTMKHIELALALFS